MRITRWRKRSPSQNVLTLASLGRPAPIRRQGGFFYVRILEGQGFFARVQAVAGQPDKAFLMAAS